MITATGKGYHGGTNYLATGESYTGPSNNRSNGGGGGSNSGGSYATVGYSNASESTYGSPTLETLYRGSGGGYYSNNPDITGGDGGGIIFISADMILLTGGTIQSDGNGDLTYQGATGGSGGSIYLCAETLNLGTGNVTANGSQATNYGGDGRIRFDFVTRGNSESSPVSYKCQPLMK